MSRTYNELGLVYSNVGYDYSGRVTLYSSSTGVGSGSSGSSTVHTRIVNANGVGAGTAGGTASVVPAVRTSGIGTSTASSVSGVLRTILRGSEEGNGYGSQTGVNLHTVVRGLDGAGIGGQSCNGTRTGFGVGTSSAVGSSFIVVVRIVPRFAANSSVGASVVVRKTTGIRTILEAGTGSVGVALWVNAGISMNDELLIPPTWAKGAKAKYRRK